MRALVVFLAIAVVIIAVYLILRSRSGPRLVPREAGEVRREIIDELADPDAEPPVPPERPAGLDARLPGTDLDALRALWPPTEANWETYLEHYVKIMRTIETELDAIDPDHQWIDLLSPERRTVLIVEGLEAQVNNGGFEQFYLNSSGDAAAILPDALRAFGCPEIAEMMERGNAQFPGGPSRVRARRLAQMDALPESASKAWDDLDSEFYGLDIPFGGIGAHFGARFILDHPDAFFLPR